ncbi:hypothetical protein RN001_005215 [Aquatica leii]|uniref:Peptidase M10 metallopeptidase domain-containing protein n=1 Tax=Aquatica leii TaxID=1421715 RepID=A0AAN7SAG5_9COLE|nr:hypothetical protein RN001_005215 [Aquatica leii]
MWEKYANIKFEHTLNNPNILISFKNKIHSNENNNRKCGIPLVNSELAHAFFPSAYQNVTEIHLKSDIDWNEEISAISNKKLSLFLVLAHAIGIEHFAVSNALMFPYYKKPKEIFNAVNFTLSLDDLLAVENLYGKNKLEVLNIFCPNISILEQLRNLLLRLTLIEDKKDDDDDEI